MFSYSDFQDIDKRELEQIEDALREAQYREMSATGSDRMLWINLVEALQLSLAIVDNVADEIAKAETAFQDERDEYESAMKSMRDQFRDIKTIATQGENTDVY